MGGSRLALFFGWRYYEDVDILHRYSSVNRHGVLRIGSELRHGEEARPSCNLPSLHFDGMACMCKLGCEFNGAIQID